jgi:hypothetical protein
MKKVISHLIGGLGNQMFQYAAGRALALTTGRDLELDISDFPRYPLRPFLLDRFQLAARPTSSSNQSLIQMRPRDVGKAVRLLLGWKTIKEQQHSYHEIKCGSCFRVIYLKGYWQTEKYFAAFSDTIRSDFALKSTPAGDNRTLLDRMDDCESVAVHIRRGDYVSNPAAASFHGLCGLDYYHEAIKQIEARVEHPHLFIFSDDIPWARLHFKTPHPMTFIDHNSTEDPCEDLRLMSACRHFVIANSSFSWWGAWLSENHRKVIVAPRKWFQSDEKDTHDQIPAAWIQI